MTKICYINDETRTPKIKRLDTKLDIEGKYYVEHDNITLLKSHLNELTKIDPNNLCHIANDLKISLIDLVLKFTNNESYYKIMIMLEIRIIPINLIIMNYMM